MRNLAGMKQLLAAAPPCATFAVDATSTCADCGNFPSDWGVANAGDLTNLTKTQPATALKAYGNFVAAVYNTTIGWVLRRQ